MKLQFYYNPKITNDEMHIGKNGQLRIKALAAEQFGIEKGQRWLVGVDVKEKSNVRHIYLVKDESKGKGYKISGNRKTGLHVNIRGAVKEMKVEIPVRCLYEKFVTAEHTGIKLTLLNMA